MATLYSPNYVKGNFALAFDRAVILGLIDINPARMIGSLNSKKPSVEVLDIRGISKSIFFTL